MSVIGFIGLGTMGRPMAERLIQAGHQVRLNRVKAASSNLVELGGVGVDTPAMAAQGAEFVILMLPNTPDVEAVLFGQGGVCEGLSPDALVIDMSSIDPVATRDFAKRVEAKGARYLDAPVSGGEIGAKNGTLSIMVGGDEEQFSRARPLFETMGKNITLVGANGAGQVAKVANQIIVGLTIEAVSEALVLAEQAGANLEKVREALLGGFAHSRILEVHGKRMIDKTFDPGFALRLHHKDLSLATDAAQALGVKIPNTSATRELMSTALKKGNGDRDHSALFLEIRDLVETE
ncbi:2-hydroxy-3-oxopropionate reductase [Ensifer sp. SSB1]|uniref:2-hydroxy-3-oxopropionate reductase n=1 Tax=Ensifer sp. SSB1 TaxID=2795385 RepID=UPI0025C21312|nr:2-hydroxy-3-oxopropionate reductase [Ensifer sp. SSB1]